MNEPAQQKFFISGARKADKNPVYCDYFAGKGKVQKPA